MSQLRYCALKDLIKLRQLKKMASASAIGTRVENTTAILFYALGAGYFPRTLKILSYMPRRVGVAFEPLLASFDTPHKLERPSSFSLDLG